MFDLVADVRSRLAVLARDFDPEQLSGDEAVRLAGELGRVRAIVDGLAAKTGKRIEDTRAFARRGDRNAAQTVARALGIGTGEARRTIATAVRLEALPATDAAVRSGMLSARQAELIAEAASYNPAAEATLLARASEGMVPLRDACLVARVDVEDPDERARRQHVTRGFRTWTRADGMVAGSFELTPEVGGRVRAYIEAAVQRAFRDHRDPSTRESHEAYAADAFAQAILGTGESKGIRTAVHVVVDHAALVRGNTLEGERCEIPGVGPVNVKWVQEMIGEAFLTLVVRKGRDITTVAHGGRRVPAELRTALIVGGRECDAPGCHQRGYLELDHTYEYARGGPTAWWNLRWLCYVHHKRKTALARAG